MKHADQFFHLRVQDVDDSSDDPSARGGITVCRRSYTDGSALYYYSICSTKDQFNKKIGRAIAQGRLAMRGYLRSGLLLVALQAKLGKKFRGMHLVQRTKNGELDYPTLAEWIRRIQSTPPPKCLGIDNAS